jgi:hypothetical protein
MARAVRVDGERGAFYAADLQKRTVVLFWGSHSNVRMLPVRARRVCHREVNGEARKLRAIVIATFHSLEAP